MKPNCIVRMLRRQSLRLASLEKSTHMSIASHDQQRVRLANLEKNTRMAIMNHEAEMQRHFDELNKLIWSTRLMVDTDRINGLARLAEQFQNVFHKHAMQLRQLKEAIEHQKCSCQTPKK